MAPSPSSEQDVSDNDSEASGDPKPKRVCKRRHGNNAWADQSAYPRPPLTRWQFGSGSETAHREDKDVSTPHMSTDRRRWTTLHIDAVNNGQAQSTYLTPPSDHGDCRQVMPSLNVNSLGPDSMTPLMLAAMHGHTALSSPPTVVTPDGTTITDLDATTFVNDITDGSIGEKSESYLKQLLSMGAEVNLQTDTRKETALHMAARCCRVDHARVLLAYGADPTARDANGLTPLHSAVGASAMGVLHVS